MNNYQYQKSQREKEKLDKTSTKEIFAKENKIELYNKWMQILKKIIDYEEQSFSNEEKEIIRSVIDFLHSKLKDTTVVKIVPSKYIEKYLNFRFALKKSMARKADIDNIINECKINNENIYEKLYKSLRLDYENNEFLDESYMGLLEVNMPKFCIRSSIGEDLYKYDNNNTVVLQYDFPFSGIGITTEKSGLPEFYINIYNDSSRDAGFPIEAFDVDIYIISRESNEKVLLASYSSETIDGMYLYDNFEIKLNPNKSQHVDIINGLKLNNILEIEKNKYKIKSR